MADPHVLSALQDKAHELRSAIVSYEEHLERTRRELAVITATIAIFERGGVASTDGRPAHVRNLFKRGEPLVLCKAALAEAPAGMTTRALAVACLAARGFDGGDPVLVRAMVGVFINTLKKAVRRGELALAETGRREAGWITGLG